MGEKSSAVIAAEPSKCAGCIICELRCSLRFENAFNPARSAIIITRLASGDYEYEISFTEKCDGCGICARYCPYDALSMVSREGVSS